MSADYISVGFTRNISHVSEDEAFAIIEEYVKEVAEYAQDWDDNDLLGMSDISDSVEATRQLMRIGISTAYDTDMVAYIIGDTGREFVAQGDMTWGDEPFEGFSNVCAVLNIVTQWESLGQKIGIIGWGIILD